MSEKQFDKSHEAIRLLLAVAKAAEWAMENTQVDADGGPQMDASHHNDLCTALSQLESELPEVPGFVSTGPAKAEAILCAPSHARQSEDEAVIRADAALAVEEFLRDTHAPQWTSRLQNLMGHILDRAFAPSTSDPNRSFGPAETAMRDAQANSEDVVGDDPLYLLALAYAEELDGLRSRLTETEAACKRWQKIADQRAIEVADLKTSAASTTPRIEPWLAMIHDWEAHERRIDSGHAAMQMRELLRVINETPVSATAHKCPQCGHPDRMLSASEVSGCG